jgi:penicillin-binding protein 2
MRFTTRQPMKNPHAEAEKFRRRAAEGFLGIALALSGLAFGYFRLQVLQHQEYSTRSEANRIKARPIVPARGLIYDRNGKLLADNVPAFRLEITSDKVDDLNATLTALSQLVAITPDELVQFKATRKAVRSFFPVVLKLRLSEEERARLAVNRYRFPGVEVVPYLTRRYPYGNLFGHVIGYVGRLDVKDLEKLGDSKYSALTHIGKSGIESFYEKKLRGEIGYEEVETNVDGRAIRVLKGIPAKPGSDLRLTIDADLQQAMVTAFGDFDGSAVAVDPRTGEILAMVSLPSYDPNLFVNGISFADYRALTDNLSRPLFNRNLQGGGPPGSTIKPFVGLAGLESGLRKPEDRIFSSGEFHIPGQRRGYRDAEAGGVGWVDLKQSIAQSVNTYYYQLAMDMGIQRFDQYLSQYGFGQKTGIDLVGESSGVLPSPEWKRNHSKEPWYLGETVISGIGQGYWVVTALQLAQGVSTIADNGVRHRLHLVSAQRQGFNTQWQPEPLTPSVRIADAGHVAAIRDAMVAVVQTGTAHGIGVGAPYQIAGKTGTAQRVGRKGNISLDPHSLPFNLRHQALFISYAPADNPKIAMVVVVEHGGFGASTAAPISRRILDAYLLPKNTGTPAPIVEPPIPTSSTPDADEDITP